MSLVEFAAIYQTHFLPAPSQVLSQSVSGSNLNGCCRAKFAFQETAQGLIAVVRRQKMGKVESHARNLFLRQIAIFA